MPQFRIVRGHVRDLVFNRQGLAVAPVIREGWWWVSLGQRPDGLPYDPEGAFHTKESARRHLWATLTRRDGRIRNIRWKDGRVTKRFSMRRIPSPRPTPRQEWRGAMEWIGAIKDRLR